MGKRISMLLACLLMTVSMAFAQTKVTGSVVDNTTGEPLIGAGVLVKGTSVGVATDVNGQFTIENVPAGASTLVVSYLGMVTKEMAIKPIVKVFLTPQDNSLNEQIVIAYGVSKKESFTGSAAVIDGKELELRPLTDITKGIDGQATGILSTSGSGQPGDGASIHIRGWGSINAAATPLYVVDGIPYDGNINSISPSDIEQMSILKDASATALYGARAANGVVMVTTKKGHEGKPQVTWRSTLGWTSPSLRPYSNVSQKDYVQLTYEALRNGYVFDDGNSWSDAENMARAALGDELGGEQYNPFKNYTWGTIIDPATGQVRDDAQSAWDENWYDAVKRKSAFRQEHQFSVSGGTDRTKYMFSLGYLDENGILRTTGFKRYTGRGNVDTEVTDWFSAGVNLSMTHSKQNFSDYDGTSYSNTWYTAQFVNPLFPIYLKDNAGQTIFDANGEPQLDWGEGPRPGSMNDFNPLGMLLDDKAYNKRDGASFRSHVTFGGDKESLGVFKGLKFTMNFGFDYNNRNTMSYMNMNHGNQASSGGLISKESGRIQSYTFNQLVTYTRGFGNHNLDLLVGHEYYDYKYEYLSAGRQGLIEGIYELRPGAKIYDADSYSDKHRINSFLSRLNYNYGGRYYFDASLRSDASSRFNKSHHTGTFWSLGANWRISEESFMKDIDWINNLSLKASYGMQGNENLSSLYAWQGLYNVGYPNGYNSGAIIASLENKDLGWEKMGDFNMGVEASLFDRRVRLEAEWYYRKTTDMLLNYPMALSTGFSGYDANVGNMRNCGVELSLNVVPVRTKDWTWDITLMGSTTKNKVLKLTKESPQIIQGIRVIEEGKPIHTYYMAKSAGVDPATGQQLYWAYDKDENGEITNEYITTDKAKAASSKYYQGSRNPDFYGSVGTNLRWKNFALSILTTYSIGGKIYDSNYASTMDLSYFSSTWNKNVLRRWQKPGDVTDVPRMEINPSYQITDRYLVNASYWSIKNITLSYTLPKSLLSRIGFGDVRLFGSVDNLVTLSHLNGMNPQYNFSGGTDYTYIPTKTFNFGVEINF